MMWINYLKKELKQGYIESNISFNRTVMNGLFIGIFGFSLYFMLQTVIDSVLNDAFPYIFFDSYYSVLYIYTMFAAVFFTIYFLIHYDYISFSEISKNKWYSLIKMGYKPFSMIINKIIVNMLSIFTTYTIGFATTILMTSFLKFKFITSYFMPMYIYGLIDIIIMIFLTMTISLVVKKRGNARYCILASAVLMIFLRFSTEYHKIVTNRLNMQKLKTSLSLTQCSYISIIILILILCVIFIIIFAKKLAVCYNANNFCNDRILVKNYVTGKICKSYFQKDARFYAVIDVISDLVIIFIVIVSLLVNTLVLLVSVATPEREVSIGGYIPYVFKSSTMEPEIEMNDLAFFDKIATYEDYNFSVGEIVLFKENGKIFVERITDINNNKLNVDIIKYKEYTDKEAFKKIVAAQDVYGVYASRNRWLGALILFFNSVFGRIIFLVIPAVIIFFYKPIINAIRKHNERLRV